MPAAPGVSDRSILKLIETVRLIRGQRFVVLAFHATVRISCFAQLDTSSESDKANAFIDRVFDEQADSELVYAESVAPLVQRATTH